MSNRNQDPVRLLALVDPAAWPDEDQIIVADIPYDDTDAWMKYAVCAQTDPESFFPEKGGSTKEAKRMCLTCEVRPQCLRLALVTEERFGIWGGLSERERRKLRKKEQAEQDAAVAQAAADVAALDPQAA